MAEKRDYISFSQIDKYCMCGPAYKFYYVDGLKLPPGASLILGSEYHRVLETNHRQKVDSMMDLEVGDLKDLFADGVEASFDGEVLLLKDEEKEMGKDAVMDRVLQRGFAALEKYHSDLAPTLQPLEIEKKFSVDLGGDLPPLFGVIDLITIDMEVVDHKSGAKSPAKDAAETSLQLSAYALGFKSLYGYLPESLQLHYVPVTSKTNKASVVKLVTQRSEEQIERFLNRVRLVVDGIRKGVFIPPEQGHWVCGYCGYKEIGACML